MGRDPWGDYDFLFGAAQMRLAIAELPVHYRERIAGTSKMRAMKHTVNLLKMCARGFLQVKFQSPLQVENLVAPTPQSEPLVLTPRQVELSH